jgi:TatD DNase family protein
VLIDSHAHLDLPAFNRDREEVLKRAREMDIGLIVNMGCDLESSQASLDLAEGYPEVFAAIGFHPNCTARLGDGDLPLLAELSRHPKVVAIGEIGLDFYRDWSPQQIQLEALQRQLELAEELDLPVILHCRRAHEELLQVLTRWRGRQGAGDSPRGIIHCFSGDAGLAQRYLELGFFISLAGPVTYPSSRGMMDLVQRLPLDRLILETDSPYLPPQRYRGQRNEPAYLPIIARRIAEIRGITVESLAENTTQNTLHLFQLLGHKERSPVAN